MYVYILYNIFVYLKGGLACSCPEADRWDHFAVLSRVAAVVTSRPTTLARLANEVNHRDVEPKMEQFGPAEAADGDREHEQNVVKLLPRSSAQMCCARFSKSAQTLHAVLLSSCGFSSLTSAVRSKVLKSSARQEPQESTEHDARKA